MATKMKLGRMTLLNATDGLPASRASLDCTADDLQDAGRLLFQMSR